MEGIGTHTSGAPGPDTNENRKRAFLELIGWDRSRMRLLYAEGYQSRPFGCEVGSQFRRGHVFRSPPIMPDGRVSQVRLEILAFRW
jgi:hypothetical protein